MPERKEEAREREFPKPNRREFPQQEEKVTTVNDFYTVGKIRN